MRFNEKKYPALKFRGKTFPSTMDGDFSDFTPVNYQYYSKFICDLTQDNQFVHKLIPCISHLSPESGVILFPNVSLLGQIKNLGYNLKMIDGIAHLNLAIIHSNGIISKLMGKVGDLGDGNPFSVQASELTDEEYIPESKMEVIYCLMSIVLVLLLIKQFAEIEEVIVNRENRRARLGGEKHLSESNQDITIVDSNWFREIIRTEGFLVRGHFRLQPFGEGRQQRRLKWIAPFQKHGYRRKAKSNQN